MNKKNYQKIMEDLIRENCTAGEAPSLLLHSCCAPCSSYCIACLAEHFHVTVFYYNPNIYPPEEYHMRAKEQERFIAEFPTKYPVSFVEGAYDTQRFYDMAKGMEEIPEGGERCFACYRLRLSESASYAKAHGFDFFTTTLSISPLKNAEKLNQIGAELADTFGVRYMFSDFIHIYLSSFLIIVTISTNCFNSSSFKSPSLSNKTLACSFSSNLLYLSKFSFSYIEEASFPKR